MSGYGKNIPPDIEQVIIYFAEKGQPEKKAMNFFHEFALRKWKNHQGKTISNWKVHAWGYIYGY